VTILCHAILENANAVSIHVAGIKHKIYRWLCLSLWDLLVGAEQERIQDCSFSPSHFNWDVCYASLLLNRCNLFWCLLMLVTKSSSKHCWDAMLEVLWSAEFGLDFDEWQWGRGKNVSDFLFVSHQFCKYVWSKAWILLEVWRFWFSKLLSEQFYKRKNRQLSHTLVHFRDTSFLLCVSYVWLLVFWSNSEEMNRKSFSLHKCMMLFYAY
jgi:hypothetical protein